MTKDTKKKNPMSIANLKQQIEKEYGEGSVMIGKNSIVKVDTFPTRVASIDQAFGCGGIPQGRILEVYGMESSGKTTTCLQFIKACQQHYFPDKVNEEGEMGRKGVVAFIDAFSRSSDGTAVATISFSMAVGNEGSSMYL